MKALYLFVYIPIRFIYLLFNGFVFAMGLVSFVVMLIDFEMKFLIWTFIFFTAAIMMHVLADQLDQFIIRKGDEYYGQEEEMVHQEDQK